MYYGMLCLKGLSVSGFAYYRFMIKIPEEFVLKLTIEDLPKISVLAPATDVTRALQN